MLYEILAKCTMGAEKKTRRRMGAEKKTKIVGTTLLYEILAKCRMGEEDSKKDGR